MSEETKKSYKMSDALTNAYDQIKTSILGNQDPQSVQLDQDIDNVISSLSSNIVNKDAYNYAETIKSMLTQNIDSTSFDTNIGHTLLATPENVKRFGRYMNADDVEMNISQCGRGLKVLADSIISPDNVTKEIIQIFSDGEDESIKESIKNLKNIVDELDFENELYPIVYHTLKYGDYFLEIADYKSKDIPITQSLYLAESAITGNTKVKKHKPISRKITFERETINEYGIRELEDKTIDFNIEIVEEINESDYNEMLGGKSRKVLTEEDNGETNKKKPNPHDLDNIRLINHDPRRVIKLQSERYRMNLGYLVVPAKMGKTSGSVYSSGIGTSQLSNIGGLSNNKGIDGIYADVIKMIRKYVNTTDIEVDSEELKELLRRALKDLEDTGNSKSIKIRYVPPERMEHFTINATSNFPYGEGIFEKSMYNAKHYIAMKSALTIKTLSDATEKRLIYVDTTLPRNSRNMLESIKEKMKKTKYSMDTFGNIGSINTMLTNYQELFIPMNKQREYVRFDVLPPSTDLRNVNDNLETYRDDIISSIEVPPAFIGIEKNISNKCLPLFTKINLINNTTITLGELIEEYENTGEIKDKWAYSYDINEKKIVPGKISWGGKTRLNAKLVEVVLDNGEKIISTPDHKFMLRNGKYKEAQLLEADESLMPLYTKIHGENSKGTPYLEVYHPGLNKWERIHRTFAISEGMIEEDSKLVIHHIDFNPSNNNINNLLPMNRKDHMDLHHSLGHVNGKPTQFFDCVICDKKYIKKTYGQRTCLNEDCKFKLKSKVSSERAKQRYKGRSFVIECKYCGTSIKRRKHYVDSIKSGIITCGKKECYTNSLKEFHNSSIGKTICSKAGKIGGKVSGYKWTEETKENAKLKRKENKLDKILNHKVVSVKFLEYTLDTGDITVDKYHNFATNGVIVSNSTLAHESILFADTIVSYQKTFSKFLFSLFSKISKYTTGKKISKDITITFSPPKFLRVEREADHAEALGRIIAAYNGSMDIPKEFLKKTWVSMDWDKIDEFVTKDILDKKSEPKEEPDGMMGMGVPPAGPPQVSNSPTGF